MPILLNLSRIILIFFSVGCITLDTIFFYDTIKGCFLKIRVFFTIFKKNQELIPILPRYFRTNPEGEPGRYAFQHCRVKEDVVRGTGSFVTSLPVVGDSGK
jgi:hypothetical protein